MMTELNFLKKKVSLVVIVTILLMHQGCATRMSHITPNARNQFARGQIILDCQLSCHFVWSRTLPKLAEFYVQGEWQQLADEVIRIGFLNDLSYFYLGRAAEGLGYYQAALIYYQNSANAFEKGQYRSVLRCKHSFRDQCNGINLPQEQITHQMAVQNKLNNAMHTIKNRQNSTKKEKLKEARIRQIKQISNSNISSTPKASDSQAGTSDWETLSPSKANDEWETPLPASR